MIEFLTILGAVLLASLPAIWACYCFHLIGEEETRRNNEARRERERLSA